MEHLNHHQSTLPKWLCEERDACGVGFIANLQSIPSHEIIQQALLGLTCVEHRGGCSADMDSGDGAGVLTQIPWEILQQSISRPLDPPHMGVAMIFLPSDDDLANIARETIEDVIRKEGFKTIGWRSVPVNDSVLGIQAKSNQPRIEQLMVLSELTGDELENRLYSLRRRIGKAIDHTDNLHWSDNIYICSFSNRTIVYKGMVRSSVLGQFYGDLSNPIYKSTFAIYHRRFSTNTMPKWPLAQPMRLLGHNGEINTLLGNINWMAAKEADFSHPSCWGDRITDFRPIVALDNSDSATLDNVLELLVRSGRTPMEALMIMVPEAYQNQPDLVKYPEITDFYEYYSGLQEPWDGPALLSFSDGKVVGATLDRNGLRPARYVISNKGFIAVASEAGVVNWSDEEIIEKGRLGPGQMIAVELDNGKVWKNWEIKGAIAKAKPYGSWLQAMQTKITPQLFTPQNLSTISRLTLQTAFGYTAEDLEMIISEMASQGKEPTFCMGDDAPLALLSDKPHILYDYFKQRFAQVTNPPIDPLRENLVMSLGMSLGPKGNLLNPQPEDAKRLKITLPILNDAELDLIRESQFATTTLSTLYPIANGPQGLAQAIQILGELAVKAIESGSQILILSDRHPQTINSELTYIPPLLAIGSVHHYLIKTGNRAKVSLIMDTAQCWSTHHFACLIGYGAAAVNPYLAYATVEGWLSDPKTVSLMERDKLPKLNLEQALSNYRKAVKSGLEKILSKMGISLLSSYQGAQIFEAIGIGSELLELGFKGTASRVGGLCTSELASEVMSFHSQAFPELTIQKLKNYGFVQFRPQGEYHMNNPEMAKALHKAIAEQQYDHYQLYQQQLQNRSVTALRDLLTFKSDRQPIPLDQVEPITNILHRFCTGGMSLGALSREAHETLAIAMNRIGGKSNSGEGGEDPVRFKILDDVDDEGLSPTLPHLRGLKNGDTASSAIKQVASGRFGVTPEYLMSGKQIEIKIAQGAKPGEGGQLPGKKVSSYIASLRRSKPGVTLISPPPHHDIYSIEDLAQLIFDLHQINPNAQVSVKLVAEIGIGTIAAGVAKANADIIQISGHDGGTGASPLSSIKHAGSPWELGLTEVHRVLMDNQLRNRVILRVDGGLKTGWDIIMAALMGAEEYGFGSVAMIAAGCIMARICHTNNCPVGVATQRDDLRKRFPGLPEQVVNFFTFIAQEVRSILAQLGYHSLDEIIGRADLLTPRPQVKLAKTNHTNLDCITKLPDTKDNRTFLTHEVVHSNGPVLDDNILADSQVIQAIANQTNLSQTRPIVNTDRTVGARIAGFIAKNYGNNGFTGQLNFSFTGSAGQSFGAFNLPCMTLQLIGEANDYVGKGMHGGRIIIKPPSGVNYDKSQNVIIGNTCLYGATGGYLFANGQAGERFAVRNSMAQAVVEGTGDHCCEYMTGGVVVVLGSTGRNVGAGMTGGLAYFLDIDGNFPVKVNPEIVKIQRIQSLAGEEQLKTLIQMHYELTQSPKAQDILAQWSNYLPLFWQVVPPSEADSPEASQVELAVSVK